MSGGAAAQGRIEAVGVQTARLLPARPIVGGLCSRQLLEADASWSARMPEIGRGSASWRQIKASASVYGVGLIIILPFGRRRRTSPVSTGEISTFSSKGSYQASASEARSVSTLNCFRESLQVLGIACGSMTPV